MADGLQSFNISNAGLPPPGLQPTQFTAPANYPQGAIPPQFSSPALPPPVSYAPQVQQAQSATVQAPAVSHPPPFLAVLSGAEKNLNRQLSQDEFDKLATDYKTDFAVPALNSQFKGKKANVEAEVAAFDNQLQHLRDQRYGAGAQASAGDIGNIKAFGLGALGGLEKGGAGIGVLAASLADAFGLAPNKVADWLRSQANPNQNADAALQVQQLQNARTRLLSMYPQDADKIKADLDPKIAALTSTASTPNLIARANTNTETASAAHPISAFLGGLGGQLAPFLLTRGAGTLATATGEAVGNTGANAAQQLAQGQNLGNVQAQSAIDVPLETLAAYLPAHFNGKLLQRALKGAAVGGGFSGAQQAADVAVNPNNEVDAKSVGANAALAALIAAIPGAHINNALRGKSLKRPDATPKASETAPQAAPPAAKAPAAATPAEQPQGASTLDVYKNMLDTAPASGIEQPDFVKLQASALEKANAQAKKYKTEIQNANTPDKVVQGAWALAKRFTGKQWDTLNAEQRDQTVETLAAWLGKKSKVKPEDIAAHLDSLRNPQEPVTTPQGLVEQPLPADISGTQVPDTVQQEAKPKEDLSKIGEMGKGIADSFYDGYWDTLTNGPKASSAFKNESSYPLIAKAVADGKITSRDQLKSILNKAESIKSSGLKNKKVAATPATAKQTVADTVTEALTDKATPETQKNKLKARVKQQTEAQYNKGYFQALANRDKAPSSPEEAKLREDPAFNLAAEAMRQGKISTPTELGKFLKEQKGTSTVGDELAGHESKQVGALLGSKSTKSDIVKARKAVRNSIVEPLVKLGEDRATINKMTVAQATGHLQKLANTFTSTEPKTESKAGKTTSEKQNPPKSEAPAEQAGATTPLEAEIKSRFGSNLPQNRIDELHDAIAAAQIGDKGDLTDLLSGLKESGDLTKEDIKWAKELAKEPVLHDYLENNASGESSASLEAQHRLADEKAAGQTRAIIRKDGSVEPLYGVDAVDTHARSGEVIAQRNIGKNKWTILSHGEDLTSDTAAGKLNKAADQLDSLHEESKSSNTAKEKVGEYDLNIDDLDELYLDRQKKLKDTPLESERVTPIQTRRRVDKILKKIQNGADVHETGIELQKLSSELEQNSTQKKFNRAMKDRRRGVEWVRAQLQRIVADYDEGSDHYRAAKFAQWLLNESPHVADDLGWSLRQNIDGAGYYNPLSKIVGLNSTDTNPTTAVHELMHASERLMPEEIQNKLRGEYIGRLQNKIKQQQKAGNKWAVMYLQTALRNFASKAEYNEKVMINILKERREEVPAGEYYKYFNPSEYWAVESTDILNRRYSADSWIAKAKEWMNQYVQHVKSFLKLDNNSKIYSALKEVLRTRTDTEVSPNSRMLSQKDTIAKDYSENQVGEDPSDEQLGYETAKDADTDPNMEKTPTIDKNARNLNKVTTGQKAIEQSMNAGYGLEKAMQQLRAKGIKVDENINVEDAAYSKNGLVSEYNSKDFDEAFNPVDNLVSQIYTDHANTKQEFIDKLNKFFQNTHFIERAKTDWALESPLDGTAGFDRADLLEQVSKNEIDPEKAAKELQKLVAKHSTITWQEWAEKNNVPLETMQSELEKLDKESGISQKTMAELNSLMDGARNRITERLQAAGIVGKADPWVKFYGWKWYVPLKGSAYGGGPDNNFDLIPSKRIALSRLNSQMKTMDGRTSFAERPFSRLFVDMARAGERQANSHVLDKVYNLAVDHGKEIGATIETFEGRPKDGYTNTRTGEEVDRLKAPASGVIINDGDTHYVVTLPKDSQLLRGLIQLNNVERPNALEKVISKGTNTLARLYTTVHPGWQTFSGFIRDLTYIPITHAATEFSNPLEAIPVWKDYGANVLQAYKALPTLIPHLLADNPKALRALGLKTPRQMGEASPNSWAGWTRRYEAAGGANYFTQGFDVAGMERLMQTRLKEVDGVLDATKWGWRKILEYTGNYANFLEGIGRVAMFKTLVERGASEKEAAVKVRKLLDYSQSGIKGRRINSWLAFFRVGMTGADAMRRAFTKPTGGLDFKKMAAWQGFMGALGAIGYMSASAMLGKDEDGKDRISKVDPSLLTQKILFPLGDKIAGVNLGLGLPQVLMAPGILGAAIASGHIKDKDAVKIYMDTLARNGPITPAGTKGNTPTDFLASYVLGFTPTVVRPLVDVERNTTVFNSSIHSDLGNNKYPSDSGRTNTPQTFKDMARWLADTTDHKIDYAPEDIRYMIQSYGGQWATDLVKIATSSPDVDAGAPPEPSRLAGKLLVDTSHYMQNEMYDALDQLQDSRRRYNSIVSRAKDSGSTDSQAKAQADQIVSRDPKFKAQIQAYRTLDNARKTYQKKVTELRTNKLLSDTRKRLMRKRLDTELRAAIEKAQTAIPTE